MASVRGGGARHARAARGVGGVFVTVAIVGNAACSSFDGVPYNGSAVTSISAGDYHTCVVAGQTVFCWGDNRRGQLGIAPRDSITDPYASPIAVHPTMHATQVSAGGQHTCAITVDGTVQCWGENTYGQLAVRDAGQEWLPHTIDVPAPFRIYAGVHHSCAVLTNNTVWCWGRNEVGQLANGPIMTAHPTPVEALRRGRDGGPDMPLESIADAFPGFSSTCAKDGTGTVRCWGANSYGQLGVDGGPLFRADGIVQLPPGVTVQEIALRMNHACARDQEAAVYCWGANESGQLGNGDGGAGAHTVLPVRVSFDAGALTIRGIAAGGAHTCALTANEVFCWGDNQYGQLGDGTTANHSTPQRVHLLGGLVITQLVAGLDHSCVLTRDSQIYCWGANGAGQLGNGRLENATVPTLVGW